MLDYFDTTGIEAIDYYVSDSFSTPAGGRQKFSEKLIILDQPRLVYEPPAYAPPVSVRNPNDDEIVFGSFNRHQKIIPEVVATWSGVLREVPNSRLLLKNTAFAHAEIQAIFLQRFAGHGIDPARISFRGASPHEQALAEYGDMDIALDTFPYNGGLTTLEALWMGTPVIAMEGERIISRQSAGMMRCLGLPEFVAKSAAEFAAIGKYWSLHRTQLNSLRQTLRERMTASPLTDAAKYTRDLEGHLEEAWELYLAQRG
jgi:predicted O-linked N-acetylglucosamine transferase (SPINDLY family)